MKKIAAYILVLIAAISIVTHAQTPLTNLLNLRGKTDSNGALYITNFAAAAPDTPLTSISNLRGKTDSNGALYVTCSGCSASFPLSATTATDNTEAAPQYTFQTNTGTGMFYNFGSIAFSVGGSRKMELDSAAVIRLTGDSSGLNMGAAADLQITRRAANEFGLSAVTFAALGTPANGTFGYCSDCTIANPCAGSGTGAFAKRLNGAWVCN